jgi:DNA-binding NarL/FixJ family response regulator
LREQRILLVDDHPVVRQGIRHMLEAYPDMTVIGEAGDGPTAIDATRKLTPDVVLLDIRMPQAIGVRLVRELRRVGHEMKVIVLTAFDEDEYLYGALREGVDGYLLKSVTSEQLTEAIRLVSEGERVVCASLSGRVLERVRVLEEAQRRRESDLTEQDIQILAFIAEGMTTPAIAKEVFLSEITVKRRVSEIMTKLGAHHRAHAVSEAMRRGLI